MLDQLCLHLTRNSEARAAAAAQRPPLSALTFPLKEKIVTVRQPGCWCHICTSTVSLFLFNVCF